MAIYIDTKYRIKRNSEQEHQMRYLVQDLKIFQSYSQIVMLSAIVGYNNNLYVPIETPASDGILMQFFSQRDYDYMDFISFAHEKEQKVLNDNKKYEIFSSYANGGFPLAVNKLGIDFDEKDKNVRVEILRKYYSLLLSNDFNL